MRAKVLPLVLGVVCFLVLSSFSSTKEVAKLPSDRWELLGTRKVDYKLDRDVIHVGVRDGRFKKLKIKVSGGALNMHKMIVHYGNGAVDNIPLKHNFSRRGGSRVIDLEGNKRVIKKVVFIYDSKNYSRRKARVHLFGKH